MMNNNDVQLYDNCKSIQLYNLDDTQGLVEQFIHSVSSNENTAHTYLNALKSFVWWLEDENLTFKALTPIDIQRYKTSLEDKGYSSSTINVKLSAVRSLCNWIESIYPEYQNPTRVIKSKPQDTGHKHSALTVDEVHRVLDCVDVSTVIGCRNYVILLCMFSLGLRTVEVCRLDKTDITPRNGVVVAYIQGKGRADKNQFIPVPKKLLSSLQWYMGRRGDDDEPELFKARQGGRMNPQTISHIVKRYFRKAGIDDPRYSAHSTRHTSITVAIDCGQSLLDVQRFARHSKPETTEIYIHEYEAEKSQTSTVVFESLFDKSVR